MQQDNSKSLTWILGAALALIGIFVIVLLVSVNSQADSVSTSASVTNVSPTVDTVVVKDNGSTVVTGGMLTLNSGTTETVTLTGTVSDDNGVGTSFANGDLDFVSAKLYRTDSGSCTSGTTDNNYCYYTDSDTGTCTLGAQVDSTTINYTCTFSMEFYADSTMTGGANVATDWMYWVYVRDDSNGNYGVGNHFEVGTLLSLNIPSSISYGTLAREASTTNSDNQEMTLTQYGNDVADVEVSGTTMSCTVNGTVPIANQEWALTDLSAGTTGSTDLTGSAVDTNIGITYRTSDSTALTDTLYWNLTVPDVASGTCTGTNTITAIAG